ncbi:MAG TPA: fibronectin type III domain-containing protein [Actinomycetota bacterium]
MRRIKVASALGVAVLLTLGPVRQAGATDTDWCSVDSTKPCIVSATHAGNPVAPADTDWEPWVFKYKVGGSTNVDWGWFHNMDNDLGAGATSEVFVLLIDTGSVIPRVAFTYGDDVVVNRIDDGDGTYKIEITATAIELNDNDDCDQNVNPWFCPETPSDAWDGYLGGQITNYNAWDDVAQRESMWGMNYSTNVAATSLPPEIVNDPATGYEQLLIRMASHHYHLDGSTLWEGFAHLRIPNAFLRLTYGVDNPASMTGSGLIVTGEGSAATATIAQESGADAMLVDVEGMHFSARNVRIKRGVITPTRPTNVSTKRATAHRGKVKFDPAKARGSKITGYAARCVARRGSHIVWGFDGDSPVVVRHLRRGVAYACRVRAKSKAGPGTWSVTKKLAARP